MVRTKILVVDDEMLNQLLYTEILKQYNFDVIVGADGAEAIELATNEQPDLIVMDWNMPRLDGFEALQILKQSESTKEIPVIMITGIMTESVSLAKALDNGASDFIRKPFDKFELYARISSQINLSNSTKKLKESIEEIKRIQYEALEFKKRELAASTLRLVQLSEMNNTLVAELEKLILFVNEQGSNLIRSMISQHNVSISGDVWAEFETRFESVHENFNIKLVNQFPELTPGERKLCALLRLNLSSKQIASITSQNPSSVDMARYRLRKKLNLDQEVNIIDFLLNL